MEKNVDACNEACNVQVTDLDEDDTKTKYVSETTDDAVSKKPDALNYAAALKELKELTDYSREVEISKVEAPSVETASSSSESRVQELKETNQQHFLNQKQRSIKTVLKRNKSCANDVKVKFSFHLYFILLIN